MPRTLLVIAFLAACAVEDAPPPAPPTGPTGGSRSVPNPGPSPADAGDSDPDGDGGPAIDAADLSCGSLGDTCCPDAPFCAVEFTHCDEGLCAGCGDIAQACCNQGTPCQGGLTCSAGVCGS